jgi:hypothetical protein
MSQLNCAMRPNPDPLLAKEMAAITGPAAAQVKRSAGCSVNDRESPWLTALTGTWRARPEPLAAVRTLRGVQLAGHSEARPGSGVVERWCAYPESTLREGCAVLSRVAS